MNKSVLAVIIIAVVLVGGYVGFYAYEKNYAMPGDLKVFKDQLSSINDTSNMDNEIAALNKTADKIENYSSLKLIPLSERQKIANDLRNSPSINSSESQFENFRQNVTNNQKIASRYDYILMGNTANDIRGIYGAEMQDTLEKAVNIMNKIPGDFEGGDNKVVANDFRELADTAKTLKSQIEDSKTRLQGVINELGG